MLPSRAYHILFQLDRISDKAPSSRGKRVGMKTLLKTAPVALAAALAAALCLPPRARSADLPSSNTVQPPPAYPLKKSANGRYLVDSKGAPFLVAGNAPQALMVKLTEADADLYFSNRVAHGFNTVWINLLCRPGTGGRKDGATYDGILPFTTTDNLSAPNEAYFARWYRPKPRAPFPRSKALRSPIPANRISSLRATTPMATVIGSWFWRAVDKVVAQVSKPAVSPISNRQGVGMSSAPGLRTACGFWKPAIQQSLLQNERGRRQSRSRVGRWEGRCLFIELAWRPAWNENGPQAGRQGFSGDTPPITPLVERGPLAWKVGMSTQASPDAQGGNRQDSEHQMAHDLGGSSHMHRPGPKLLFRRPLTRSLAVRCL